MINIVDLAITIYTYLSGKCVNEILASFPDIQLWQKTPFIDRLRFFSQFWSTTEWNDYCFLTFSKVNHLFTKLNFGFLSTFISSVIVPQAVMSWLENREPWMFSGRGLTLVYQVIVSSLLMWVLAKMDHGNEHLDL